MKKNMIKIAAGAVLLASVFMFSGCSKKSETKVVNDSESAEALMGNWAFMMMYDTDVCSNPGTKDELLQGTARILVRTELDFNADYTCVMSVKNSVQSVTLNKDSIFTEEDVRANIEKSLETYGTFTADKTSFEIVNTKAKDSSGTEYDIDEYRKIDPDADKDLTVNWRIEDDVLFISIPGVNGTATYHKLN